MIRGDFSFDNAAQMLYQAKVPCITPKNAVPIQVMYQIKVVEANKVVL